MAPHLALLNTALLAVVKGSIKRLIVTMPPRHGKSELISRTFPAWYLCMYPEKRIILTSYEADFASSWGKKARDLVDEFGHVFGVQVDSSSSARNRWDINGDTGGMVTAGVGGPITGKGADCLTGDSLVTTPKGRVRIDNLVRSCYRGRVLSYNHSRRRTEWRRVKASRRVSARELIEIETESGRIIRSTPDHRIFVDGLGYKAARDISERETLVTIKKEQNMRSMWMQQDNEVSCMCRLLGAVAGEHSRGMPLRPLRQGFSTSKLQHSQAQEVQIQRYVLQHRMLESAPCSEEQAKVQRVRTANREQTPQVLSRVQESRRMASLAVDSMCLVRKGSPTPVIPDEVLRHGLQERCPQLQYDRQKESTSQDGQVIRAFISINENGDKDSRQHGLHRLRQHWHHLGDMLPPHKSRSNGQQTGESCDAMPRLSCQTPCISRERVKVVRRLCDPCEFVYDIQVEGNSNFFADEILVHNCLIIDDPVKNAEEAMSATARAKAWDWYVSTAYTRLEPDAAIVLMMTRWHQDDLAGRILADAKNSGEQWHCLDLPAIATGPDLLGRKEGEPLWPDRFSLERLETIRKTLGTLWFTSLYQQKPLSHEGAMFKRDWFRILPEVPKCVEYCRFWDLAGTEAKHGKDPDYTAGVLMGKTDQGQYVVLHVVHVRETPGTVERTVAQTAKADQAKYGAAVAVRMEQEPGQSGKAQIRHYRDNVLPLADFKGIPSGSQKTIRAQPVSSQAEAGNVACVASSWLQEYLDEMCAFPFGSHDDMVDGTSGAFSTLAKPRSGFAW